MVDARDTEKKWHHVKNPIDPGLLTGFCGLYYTKYY